MKRILVTGATGKIGRQVVQQLLETDVQVRALTRNPITAMLPREVEVIRGDLNDPETLDTCLEEIDAAFLVWTASVSTAAGAVHRFAEHARHIVFLTSPHQTAHPLFQQPNPLKELHAEIERLIRASQIGWTFLRPGMLAANALTWWAPQIRAGNTVRWPYPAAPAAPIDERDIAAVAVRTLTEPGHDRADYVLTGPESLTHLEQVMVIGDELGRALRFEELSPEELRREWKAPSVIVNMLLNAWSAAIGQPAYVTSTVADVTGRSARTFREWMADHVSDFGPLSL